MVGRQAEWQAAARLRAPGWRSGGSGRWCWLPSSAGTVALQVLGPPPQQTAAAPVAPPVARRRRRARSSRPHRARAAGRHRRPRAAGIPAPIAALLEPAPGSTGAMLPRIGPEGRMPMQAYAAPFDAADPGRAWPCSLAGIGMAETDSEAAIRATPRGGLAGLLALCDAAGPLLSWPARPAMRRWCRSRWSRWATRSTTPATARC